VIVLIMMTTATKIIHLAFCMPGKTINRKGKAGVRWKRPLRDRPNSN
jgi:hypothetical protein